MSNQYRITLVSGYNFLISAKSEKEAIVEARKILSRIHVEPLEPVDRGRWINSEG
jgi:hypothetical protein